MTSFGSGDAREGFVVLGDRLVFAVNGARPKIGFCYSEENSHGRRNSDQEQYEDYVFLFCVKSKETNSVKR